MVSNHVQDLIDRYGTDGSTVPKALTDYVLARKFYDYDEHSRVGAKHGEFVTDEICDRFCVLGTTDQIKAKLKELQGVGVDHPTAAGFVDGGAQGWDEQGRPGSVSYRESELSRFASGPVFLYLGRFTAVKRLPLLIRAHARLARPCPLVLVGGHPGEWEGEHPLETIRRVAAEQVFLAGWRPHEQLPHALNAADVLVLPSVAEAFGLALVEAMACGLPAIACASHGPAAIVRKTS